MAVFFMYPPQKKICDPGKTRWITKWSASASSLTTNTCERNCSGHTRLAWCKKISTLTLKDTTCCGSTRSTSSSIDRGPGFAPPSSPCTQRRRGFSKTRRCYGRCQESGTSTSRLVCMSYLDVFELSFKYISIDRKYLDL